MQYNDDNLENHHLLTVTEAAELLHVHSSTVRKWSNRGMLKAYRIGPRGDRRFEWEDVEQLRHSFIHRT